MATVGGTGYSSQQPAQYDPALQNIPNTTRSWGTTGNTDTLIDASIHPSSLVVVNAVNNTPNGFWKLTVTQGQVVITSSSVENAGLTYNYMLL